MRRDDAWQDGGTLLLGSVRLPKARTFCLMWRGSCLFRCQVPKTPPSRPNEGREVVVPPAHNGVSQFRNLEDGKSRLVHFTLTRRSGEPPIASRPTLHLRDLIGQ